MLFNSREFLLYFLPAVLLAYFLLQQKLRSSVPAKVFLFLVSLAFYGFWNKAYVPLLVASILGNYFLGTTLLHWPRQKGKWLLVFGLAENVGLLVYYKYADFLIGNWNAATGGAVALLHPLLPLAISFFTFQQISYLVDCYQRKLTEYTFLDYAVVVTFFPHLIAGPIIQYKEIIPQFAAPATRIFQLDNFVRGFYLLFLGLTKKLLVADTLAYWAERGFDQLPSLSLLHAWMTSFAYTFQLYFDFSGYCDMAIGLALMFNIVLPANFFSPYKSLNIQEFWRRWHITMSRFLRDYIYVPLGGSREGEWKTYRNVMAVFLVGGIWHGAGWNFLFWGFLHGAAVITYLIWQKTPYRLPRWLAWLITINFVNVAWVFFRALTWGDAIKVLRGMIGLDGINVPFIPPTLAETFLLRRVKIGEFFTPFYGTSQSTYFILLIFVLAVPLAFWARNSEELALRFRVTPRMALWTGFLLFTSFMIIEAQSHESKFLYFTF